MVQARLTPEQGAIFQQAVETGAQQLFEEQKHVSAETWSQSSEPEIIAKPHPMASRRAHAPVRISESWLAGTSHGTSSTSANQIVVNLHTDIETLRTAGTGAESAIECGAETVGKVSAEAFWNWKSATRALVWKLTPEPPFPNGVVKAWTSILWCMG